MDLLAAAAASSSASASPPAASAAAPVAPAADAPITDPNALVMRVYPSPGGAHIAKLVMPTSQAPGGAPSGPASAKAKAAAAAAAAKDAATRVPLIVILDRSGSMGANVGRLVKQVLPDFLSHIDHPADAPITLISFDNTADVMRHTAAQLKNNNLSARGGTYMARAIRALMDEVKELAGSNNNSGAMPLRILTLTDGELSDQQEALTAAQKLRSMMEGQFMVNSQAVRIFTSSAQPDTRGLTGMMQLSNATQASIIDIDMYRIPMPVIAEMLAVPFKEDGLLLRTTLEASEAVMLSAPWKSPAKSLSLAPGLNVFWLRNLPQVGGGSGPADGAAASSSAAKAGSKVSFRASGESVVVEMMPPLTQSTYTVLLREKIEFFTNQCKVLRVMNTQAAQEEIQQILSYFSQLDKAFAVSEEEVKRLLASSKGLRDRLQYFKASVARSNRSVSARLAQIANDDRISKLNSAQAAEYLRSADSASSNSKGLARRALQSGLDFDQVARAEVRAMAAHIDELKDVDDSDHTVSFYSQETTLGGIRATAGLVADDVIEDMDANDVMKMLNIVGVACAGPVGDFADPMTYRLNEIYPGCYLSLADLLTAFVVSKGAALTVPGQSEKVIVNVVPFFDDDRIHRFLRRYAPKMLEYVASVGMRRMLAEVNMTYSYTLVAGVWKCVEDLNTSRSELLINTFVKMARAYNLAIGGYFDHVLPFMQHQPASQDVRPALSFWLAKNGVTNMIAPLMRTLPDASKGEIIAPILRALYSFEVWQICRKSFKHAENMHLVIEAALVKLLNIDIDKHRTPMTALFEPPAANPHWHDEYSVNDEALTKAMEKCWFVNYLTLLPALLGPAADMSLSVEQAAARIKDAPKLTNHFIRQALGIEYDLRTFQFFNVAQAFLYPTAADRNDEEKQCSKFIDLGDRAAADAQLRSIVRKMFESRYNADLSAKSKEERKVLIAELVAQICASPSQEETIRLLRVGLSRGACNVAIVNTSSQGFLELKSALLDVSVPVTRRAETISLVLLARDAADEPIWNGGNVLFVPDVTIFRAPFIAEATASGDAGAIAAAEKQWQALHDAYMLRKRHIYRADPNRHGHSNDKPSYWALGYAVLEDMVKALSEEEWAAYKRLHDTCCGIPALTAMLQAGAPIVAPLPQPAKGAAAAASSSSGGQVAMSPRVAEKIARATKAAARKEAKQAAQKRASAAKAAAAAAAAGKAKASGKASGKKK